MSFLRAFLFLSFAFTAAWGPAASAQTITCGTSQVFTGTGSAATGLWRNAFTSNGVSYDLFASVTARTQARTSFFRCTDSGGIQVPTVSLRDNNNDPGAENNRLSVRFQIREAGTTTPVALPQVVFQMNDLDLTNGTLEVFALDIGDNYCFTSGGQIAVSEVPPQTLFSGTVNNPTDAVQVNFSNRTEFNFEVRSNDDGERHYKLSATDTSNLFDCLLPPRGRHRLWQHRPVRLGPVRSVGRLYLHARPRLLRHRDLRRDLGASQLRAHQHLRQRPHRDR
jgi:hypothetical protein